MKVMEIYERFKPILIQATILISIISCIGTVWRCNFKVFVQTVIMCSIVVLIVIEPMRLYYFGEWLIQMLSELTLETIEETKK